MIKSFGIRGIFVRAATVLPLFAMTAPVHAQPSCGPTVTVQPGDTFYAIAQRCGVGVAEILAENAVDPRKLQVGQALQMPAHKAAVDATIKSAADPVAREPELRRVQPGETVADIALSLGTSVAALQGANPHIDPRTLIVGQVIRRPGGPIAREPRKQVVGVLKGEGGECRPMTSEDGELFTLIGGKVDAYKAGKTVEVLGAPPELSICAAGTTIVVEYIRQIGRPNT